MEDAEQMCSKLRKCIKDNRLNDAKLLMKRLSREQRAAVANTEHGGTSSPLSLAVLRQYDAFVNFLLEECDADIEQLTDDATPLYRAVSASVKLDIVKILLSHGADVNVVCRGATPLYRAVSADFKLDIVKILLSHGADVNVVCRGTTPLVEACCYEDIDLVRCLVENGADIDRPDDNGITCLMASVHGISTEVALYLLEQGASINAVDKSGATALHHAIQGAYKYMDTVRLLVEHGADTSLCNEDGDNALQYAALCGKEEIVEYLVGELNTTAQRLRLRV